MRKELLSIKIDSSGKFVQRPNRFLAQCQLPSGDIIEAHVHDSGRIKELLYPGNEVYLRKADGKSIRKTSWDLISALGENGENVLVNSSFHRYISENILRNQEISPFGMSDKITAEVKVGESRLDYCIEKNGEKIFIEVKGVSLAVNGTSMFPDAPSTRAVKHLKELIKLKKEGYRTAVILLIFRNSDFFRPRWETDPVFSEFFYSAMEEGVEIYPIQLEFSEGTVFWKNRNITILKKG